MVNEYVSAEQAEASSPYASQPSYASGPYPGGQLQYAADVAARLQSGEGSYGSGGQFVWSDAGGKQRYEMSIAARQAAAQRPGAIPTPSFQSLVEQRPGYYRSAAIGDQRTRELISSGVPLGRALEMQRQSALGTPGTRDERFYENEMQKWASQPIEVSSAFHHAGYNARNPFENVGDQALVFLKGQQEVGKGQLGLFNPGAREMGRLVPKEGLQGFGWDQALASERGRAAPAPFDFMPAIDRLYASAGELGPYSNAGTTYSNRPAEANRFTTPPITPRLSDITGMVSMKWTQGYEPGAPGGMLGAPFLVSERKSGAEGFSLFPASAAEGKQVLTMDQFFAPGSKALGILAGAIPTATPAAPKTWFEETGRAIKNTPVLGSFYGAGASVSQKTTMGAYNLFTTTPILENIAKGGSVYGLMKEAGYQGTEAAQLRYKEGAGKLVGTGTNEATRIFPVAKPFLDTGAWYKSAVTTPFSTFLSPLDTNPVTGALKSGAMGFVGVPGGIAEYTGMAMIGGERTLKNIHNFPGLAAAGGAMQAEGFIRDPIGTVAGLAGAYALFSLSGTALTKGGGYLRSMGKKYIPIEQIGYDADAGFPLAPRRMTAGQLRTSFEESTLIPKPTKMSTGEAVPYVPEYTGLPGEGARYQTYHLRLPFEQTYMWTGWEASPYAPGEGAGLFRWIRGQREYPLGKGTSEIPGMYGAPVAESYFTKVGGQAPTTIGLGSPFRTPTLVRTALTGLEDVPRGLSLEVISRKAGGVPEAYRPMIDYIRGNVRAGEAAMPMTKIEYEAVLPQGNVMKITGTDYFTKTGGIGASRWFGTRIPIMEQVATGKMAPVNPLNTISQKVWGSGGSSYKPDAYLGGYSLAGSFSMARTPSAPASTASSSISRFTSSIIGKSSAISAPSRVSYPKLSESLISIKSASYLPSTPSYPTISTRPYSQLETPSYSKVSTPSYPTISTPPYSPKYAPYSYPKPPTYPKPSTPFIPISFGWPTGQETPTGSKKKRYNPFREVIPLRSELMGTMKSFGKIGKRITQRTPARRPATHRRKKR